MLTCLLRLYPYYHDVLAREKTVAAQSNNSSKESKMDQGHFTIRHALLPAVLLIAMTATGSHGMAQESTRRAETKVVLASEVWWEQLNPKRGDQSPQAATLWGDRSGTEATGFLVKFVDGFSSPPHIHNVTYRGVVIAGRIHNDDPEAKPMWMPAGSYWTQPAGEVHITASRGSGVAFIEIDRGPYLVLPVEEATDNGERPLNVDPSNIVWLNGSNTSWIRKSKSATSGASNDNGPKVAFLWGEPQEGQANGTLIKLPAGFTGKIRTDSNIRAVVIEGQAKYGETDSKAMTAGSLFSSQGKATHQVSSDSECVMYVRSDGKYEVTQE